MLLLNEPGRAEQVYAKLHICLPIGCSRQPIATNVNLYMISVKVYIFHSAHYRLWLMTIRAKRPTISDVAQIAGVSIATVSRVLQSPEIVADATKHTVTDAIRKTGYRANTAAQMLRQSRSNTVLVVLPDLANTFFSEILSGIESVATEAGLTILVGNTNGDPERCRMLLENLWNGRADGALLLNGSLPAPVEPYLEKPIATISERIALMPALPHIGTDNHAAARDATEYLIGLGHRRIVHVTGPKGNVLTAQRLEGFLEAVRTAGIGNGCSVIDGDFTTAGGIAAADSILKERSDATAVFCANDELAMGLVSRLMAKGIEVPRQLSVMGFDDIKFASVFTPSITTVRQDRRQMGRQSMEALISRLEGKSGTPVTITIPHRIVERETVIAVDGRLDG